MQDLISRQAAIDAHYEYCNKHPDAGFPVWSLKILKDLPSAQPEIVRCKDCKWVEHYGTDGNASYWCKNWDGGTDADGFCYEAERRTE